MKILSAVCLLVLITLACNLPLEAAPLLFPTASATDLFLQSDTQQAPTAMSAVETTLPEMKEPGKGDFAAYTVQGGDTLPALAGRFKTTTLAIAAENPALINPEQLTTLPAGQVLRLRLVVDPHWSSPASLLPNHLFVNGLAQTGFNITEFIRGSPGWLNGYIDNSAGNAVTGGQIVESLALTYSISPRLVLALLEYQLKALSDPSLPKSFPLGSPDSTRKTLARQLSWAANVLNNGYYGWREGSLTQFTLTDGTPVQPSPWDNAASVGIQYYFSHSLTGQGYQEAVSANGLAQTYQTLFGAVDWGEDVEKAFMPGSLKQPDFSLPFLPGKKWAFTGGPHSGWGIGEPRSALDFAPPSDTAGCDASPEWAVAMAGGVVARSEGGMVVLDLDQDGNAQTGWTIFYFHILPGSAPRVGNLLKTGDRIGHPSCSGGNSSGRNVHIARLFNGEWIPAGGTLPFTMAGWVAAAAENEYQGTLTRGAQVVRSSNVGDGPSQIEADAIP
jgi:LasA protease